MTDSNTGHSIGRAASALGLAPDTLRYYEKIGLLPRPSRTVGGRRLYAEKDLTRLRFVRRAQAIGFSLEEIRQLLRLRERPLKCSSGVRELAARKYEHLRQQRWEMQKMERELSLLLNLCAGDPDHCPILEELERGHHRRKRKSP